MGSSGYQAEYFFFFFFFFFYTVHAKIGGKKRWTVFEALQQLEQSAQRLQLLSSRLRNSRKAARSRANSAVSCAGTGLQIRISVNLNFELHRTSELHFLLKLRTSPNFRTFSRNFQKMLHFGKIPKKIGQNLAEI